MAAAAAAASAAAQAGVMRESDFERLNERPMSTSPSIQSRVQVTYVQPIARIGPSPNGTYYTGTSPLIGEGVRGASWVEESKNGQDIPWRTLGAFGMGVQGMSGRYTAALAADRLLASACGATPEFVNHWRGRGAMNWTMFPVVFKTPAAFAVIPFICMISQVRPQSGPYQPGAEQGRQPIWRVLPTQVSEGITFMVDSSHVNMENWDTQMSIVAALNVYFPRFADPGEYYVLLQPFGENSQVRNWQRQVRSGGANDEYIHLTSSGASLGLAIAACCVGLPSLMYTGYTSNIARRLTLPSRKSNFNDAGLLIGGVETAGTSDWVETVQDVDFKIGWAFANAYPIVIPMVDALTSLNMAVVMKNLTRAYSVWYPPPKGSGQTAPTVLSQVWQSGGNQLENVAYTMGQYAMFANNRNLTIYTASDVFSGGKYMSEGGVILAAGSISEALLVATAAGIVYSIRPDFNALNDTQAGIKDSVMQQLSDKASVLDQVKAVKTVAAKAKRAEKKAAGIKPKKSVPKPKRVVARNKSELATLRTQKTQYAKAASTQRAQSRAASMARRQSSAGAAPAALSRGPTQLQADATTIAGGSAAIRSAPGMSKDFAYSQLLEQFLSTHPEDSRQHQQARSYYEVMGTTHDKDRTIPTQRGRFNRRGVPTGSGDDEEDLPLGERAKTVQFVVSRAPTQQQQANVADNDGDDDEVPPQRNEQRLNPMGVAFEIPDEEEEAALEQRAMSNKSRSAARQARAAAAAAAAAPQSAGRGGKGRVLEIGRGSGVGRGFGGQ